MMSVLTIVSAVNNSEILSRNLLSSPDVRAKRATVLKERNHSSAGSAYNAGMSRSGDARVVAFIHQDVYLPAGWVDRVARALADLDDEWAVAGVWGVKPEGMFCGRVWCTGGGQEHVGLRGTNEIASVDEIVLLLNTRHLLRFDPDLPGFHLYATDIILQARARGLKSYCIEAPVVHNSRSHYQPLDSAYWRAYRYMQRKWAHVLPLKTCVVDVTRFGWPLVNQWARNELQRLRGNGPTQCARPDSAVIAHRLGYES